MRGNLNSTVFCFFFGLLLLSSSTSSILATCFFLVFSLASSIYSTSPASIALSAFSNYLAVKPPLAFLGKVFRYSVSSEMVGLYIWVREVFTSSIVSFMGFETYLGFWGFYLPVIRSSSLILESSSFASSSSFSSGWLC